MNITRFLNLLKRTGSQIDLKHIEYHRTSRGTVKREAELTQVENERIADAVVNAKTTEEMSEALDMGEKLIASKNVKFVWAVDRLPISSIVGNETRANLGILVQIPGTIELSEERPQGLPKIFGTSVWRNYCVVKDGKFNISMLPTVLTKEAYTSLVKEGVKLGPWLQGHIYEIPVDQFTVTELEEQIDPMAYSQTILDEMRAKAMKKVLKHFMNELREPDKTKTLAEMYGAEAAEWLKTIGVTDQGYAPATDAAESTGFYEATKLSVKTKGWTVPSVNELQKKLAMAKKLNAGDKLLEDIFCKVKEALDAKSTTEEKLEWLETASYENWKELNDISDKLNDWKMAILTKDVWFKGMERPAVIQNGGLTVTVEVATAHISM